MNNPSDVESAAHGQGRQPVGGTAKRTAVPRTVTA